MATTNDNALYLREIQKDYMNIIDDEMEAGVYHKKVLSMISNGECRLIVNINDIREKNNERTSKLLSFAHEEIIAFQNALKEYVSSINHEYSSKNEEFLIGFEGSFGDRHVSPRTLKAKYLNNLVCCEGIVTKCSSVNPKLTRSIHYCAVTNKSFERRYTDLTSLDAFPSSVVYPVKDDDGNALETEYGFCIYKDHQRVTIQEMPEKSPPGLLPRSIDVLIDNDLVDKCKPGDRVQIVGIFRCLPSKRAGYISGSFRSVILANYVKAVSKDIAPSLSANDIKNIRKLANSKTDVFTLLSKSIAPSISGLDYVKKAILCMLIGGSEKVLENGTRLRGDINLLLVGDPSTAKSQLLRYVLHAAPRAISSNGRGSSGVGLTAAVTTDPDTGERRLEAGAMVLGDRGIVCIDEFDKMSDMDRTALHEVMEQGRVSIAKAGIHAQLNARCSVLAAANPVHGRYDQYQTPMQNIGFQDSLLSRFDLLFTILDMVDEEVDRKISDHVLRMRQFRAPDEQEGDPTLMGTGIDYLSTENPDFEIDEEDVAIFEKHDTQLYGTSKREKFISIPFFKKYIYVAKQLNPVLTQDAVDIICRAYADLRDMGQSTAELARTLPVTARTLETLIRLSTAHAKARMSKSVEKKDAKMAVELLHFAYFQKVQKKPKRQLIKDPITGEEKLESNSGSEGDDCDTKADEGTSAIKCSMVTEITAERLDVFQEKLNNIFLETNLQSLELEYICEELKKLSSSFTIDEIKICLNKMQDDNKIMLSGETIFLI